MSNYCWTDDRVEILKKLWQDGLSASQIAKQLGGCSRNGVIGKVHRLGHSGRAMPSAPARIPRPPAPPKPPRFIEPRHQNRVFGAVPPAVTPVPPPVPAEPFEELSAHACELHDPSAHACRWPIGDPQHASFRFCGRRREDGAGVDSPYCGDHAARAYQPAQAKKKTNAAELARSLRRYI